MSLADTNKIIRDYLVASSTLVDPLITLLSGRIYCPRLPQGLDLADGPAVSYFTIPGNSTPYIPGMPEPSVQFDCWATDAEVAGEVTRGSEIAREVYRALYDALQGIQNIAVGSYKIMSAIEEIHGQDLVDVDIPNYFRVMTTFRFMIRAE